MQMRKKALLVYMLVVLLVLQGTELLHAGTAPGKPGGNMATVSWVAGGAGLAFGGACAFLEPCGAGLALGGVVLGGLGAGIGGLLSATPANDPPGPLPGDLGGEPNPPGACDLACQANQPTISAPTPMVAPGGTNYGQCSIFWGCIAQMEGATKTVKVSPFALPPTHPVRGAFRDLLPRPDVRGIALNAIQSNVLAPRYRHLPNTLLPRAPVRLR